MKWRVAPLSSGFMLASIFGIILSIFYIWKFWGPSWGFAFIIVFVVMFIASLISLKRAPVEETFELEARRKWWQFARKKPKKKK